MGKILRGMVLGLGSFLLFTALAGIILSILGGKQADRRYTVPAELLIQAVSDDPALIARGEHLAAILSCKECHGEALAGRIIVDEPPFRAVAGNLTPGLGGIGAGFEPADWDRSIRYGVLPDGRAVNPGMPSSLFHSLGDEDALALISYLSQLAPVFNELPSSELRFMGKLLVGAFVYDYTESAVDPATPRRNPPPPGADASYGAYLASVSCVDCHGEDLRGGPHPNPTGPLCSDLAYAAGLGREDFNAAMRSGRTPDGRQLEVKYMPWRAYSSLNDLELAALQAHLRELTQ
jgi:cytochrome c553